MNDFELSIKTIEIKEKTEVKIKGSRISVMNGLANLVNVLKEQSLLNETDIIEAVQAGLGYKHEINKRALGSLLNDILNY